MFQIEATQPTFLKRSTKQASELADQDKHPVRKGRTYPVELYDELENEDNPNSQDGHVQVSLGHGAGTWYIWPAHWDLPWHKESVNTPEDEILLPEWDTVDWGGDWGEPVSKYFVLGEVCNYSDERRPVAERVQKNIIMIARHMDEIREWWGAPIAVNSWNRPWPVNTRIGSRSSNHPSGTAVDFRPLHGSVLALQNRFKREWWDTGRWDGGLGLGAKKGFVHVDMNPQYGRRIWNY